MILNLTSFPRSGNSFFTTTLLAFGANWQLVDGGAVEFQPVQLFSEEHVGYGVEKIPYIYPQQMDPNPVDRIADPDRLFVYKRHDHPDDYVGPRIYLVRDGRDVLVSYARHNLVHQSAMGSRLRGENDYPDQVDKDAYFAELTRLVEMSAWGEFALNGARNPNTVETVRYEDMLRAPVTTAQNALLKCGFLVEQVAEPPTFAELNKEYPWFYNKGKANDFRNWMPPHLVKRFNEIHGEALEFFGYTL